MPRDIGEVNHLLNTAAEAAIDYSGGIPGEPGNGQLAFLVLGGKYLLTIALALDVEAAGEDAAESTDSSSEDLSSNDAGNTAGDVKPSTTTEGE